MDSVINMSEYTYDLPADRIAVYPLDQREQSRLLVYQHGQISHSRFEEIGNFLPSDLLLVFNDTKVIPARLQFQKETGALIEIFLLHPVQPSPIVQLAMQASASCSWQCSIGNLKRWSDGLTLRLEKEGIVLQADLVDREHGIVRLSWSPESRQFSEVIESFGATPLPPYLKRAAETSDKERYQTVYSQSKGAVAAPTAGLHFTQPMLEKLRASGITTDFLTLHVSAGTFLPVKVDNALDHEMHEEQIVISRKNLENLLAGKKIVAVGTTSLRTLESLYWFGVKLKTNPNSEPVVTQFDPNHLSASALTRREALTEVVGWMDSKGIDALAGKTSIFILPGYTFRMTDGLITNFHQPGSTLLLLIAALVGERWKTVYEEALQNHYRFLSYGDSSLLMP